MLQLIPDLPPHVVGLRATGEVTSQDLETVAIPAVDALVARNGGIHYLLVLETSVKNWDFGAWMSDSKLGLKYFTKWHRMAIVTDEEGVQKVTDAISAFVPGGVAKGFSMAQLEDAKAWVSLHDDRDKV